MSRRNSVATVQISADIYQQALPIAETVTVPVRGKDSTGGLGTGTSPDSQSCGLSGRGKATLDVPDRASRPRFRK